MRASQFTLFSLFLASIVTYANPEYNLTPGVTPISHSIYNLHMIVFWLCLGIGAIVFSVMIYSIVYHRKSKNSQSAQFHEHLWLEITWTIIPFLILIGLAIPGTRVLIGLNDTDKPDLTIKITGYQWKWKYDYLEKDIHFFSNLSTPYDQLHGKAKPTSNYLAEVDHPLILPIHKKIRFLITSNDVIHAWWVPALGVKRDAVPGFINESWARINRPGTYTGQCAELCGMNHSYMPIVVTAVSEKEFNDWINQQKGITTLPPSTQKKISTTNQTNVTPSMTLSDSIAKGKTIYLNICAACHKPDGTGMPPTFPNLTTSAVTKGPVTKHIHTVVFGVPGSAMQAFGQQLSPEDIAAVITYERNELAHLKGEIVKPSDIVAAQKEKSQGATP